MQNFPTLEEIQNAVANELNDALECINGPSVSPKDIEVDFTNPELPTVTVKLNIYYVPSDNYVGLCAY